MFIGQLYAVMITNPFNKIYHLIDMTLLLLFCFLQYLWVSFLVAKLKSIRFSRKVRLNCSSITSGSKSISKLSDCYFIFPYDS